MFVGKLILSSLLVATLFTPAVFANDTSDRNSHTKQSINVKAEKRLKGYQCSGRCDSCSDQNCPSRRRPFKNNKGNK